MKSVLAWRRGAQHLSLTPNDWSRDGELKHRWAKPPARSLRYGDWMTPAVPSGWIWVSFGAGARVASSESWNENGFPWCPRVERRHARAARAPLRRGRGGDEEYLARGLVETSTSGR